MLGLPNLRFSEGYYQSEYREEFLVDTTMKTLWAAEMELLSDIDAVCQKYNLQYYAYWGTMLGAVRHHGFVPWDDDMDIALKREDYNTLMKVLPKELPESYRVYNSLSEEGHDLFWGCVANADTISIEEDRLRKFHNCPFWVGIDIVPLDYIPRDQKEADMLHNFMSLIWKAVYIAKKEDVSEKDKVDLEETLSFLEKNLGTKFDKNKYLPNQLWRLGNLLASSYGEEDGDYITVHTTEVKCVGFKYEKSWWNEAVLIPFEEIAVPVPNGYDKVLTKIYGDYNIRVRGNSDHDYPYYKAQLKQLHDMIKEMEEKNA